MGVFEFFPTIPLRLSKLTRLLHDLRSQSIYWRADKTIKHITESEPTFSRIDYYYQKNVTQSSRTRLIVYLSCQFTHNLKEREPAVYSLIIRESKSSLKCPREHSTHLIWCHIKPNRKMWINSWLWQPSAAERQSWPSLWVFWYTHFSPACGAAGNWSHSPSYKV